jgi:hypothetical protein
MPGPACPRTTDVLSVSWLTLGLLLSCAPTWVNLCFLHSRFLLRSTPQATLVDMEASRICSGGAGAPSFQQGLGLNPDGDRTQVERLPCFPEPGCRHSPPSSLPKATGRQTDRHGSSLSPNNRVGKRGEGDGKVSQTGDQRQKAIFMDTLLKCCPCGLP